MGWWRDLTDLVDMYSEGGLAIVTPLSGESTAATAPLLDKEYKGKSEADKGVRTVIQLDADMVTLISEDVLINPEVWQRHTLAVNGKLAVLGTLRTWARRSWVVFLTIPLILATYSARLDELPYKVLALTLNLVGSIIIVRAREWLLRVVLAPLVMRLVMWYLQRRFQKFISGATPQAST